MLQEVARSFLPRDTRVNSVPSVSARPQLQVTRSAVGDRQQELLLHLARYPQNFPVREPLGPGRRLYASCTRDGLFSALDRLKMKGAGGLAIQETGDLLGLLAQRASIKIPEPQKIYGDAKQLHIRISPLTLKLEIVESATKFPYGLSARGAEAEFDIRLSAGKDAQPPLLAARFIHEDGSPELDSCGHATGVVFSVADSQFESLVRFTNYFLVNDLHDLNREHVLTYDNAAFSSGQVTPTRLRQNLYEIMGKIGALRMRSYQQHAIARHALHYDNFDYHRIAKSVHLSDLDSCLTTAGMTPEERGAYFLRDIASDLVHYASDVTYQNFTRTFYLKFREGTNGAFTPYLKGLFAGMLADKTIEFYARQFEKKFFETFNAFLPRLVWIHTQVLNFYQTGTWQVSQKTVSSNWYMSMVPFFADALTIVYDMMNEVSVKKVFDASRIALTKAPRAEVTKAFRQGTLQYYRALNAESVRVSGHSHVLPLAVEERLSQ